MTFTASTALLLVGIFIILCLLFAYVLCAAAAASPSLPDMDDIEEDIPYSEEVRDRAIAQRLKEVKPL